MGADHESPGAVSDVFLLLGEQVVKTEHIMYCWRKAGHGLCILKAFISWSSQGGLYLQCSIVYCSISVLISSGSELKSLEFASVCKVARQCVQTCLLVIICAKLQHEAKLSPLLSLAPRCPASSLTLSMCARFCTVSCSSRKTVFLLGVFELPKLSINRSGSEFSVLLQYSADKK